MVCDEEGIFGLSWVGADCCESSCCVSDIYECAGECAGECTVEWIGVVSSVILVRVDLPFLVFLAGRDEDAVVGDCAFLRFLLFLVVAGTISNSSDSSKESLSSSGGIKAVCAYSLS